ncbi:MAG: Eco57I restriction-modification methylase domain-containing protein [Bacillota bacterium]
MELEQKARIHLAAEPLPGVRLGRLWLGQGGQPAEVVEVETDHPLTDGDLRHCWQHRLKGRAIPLWAVAPVADGMGICGPDEPPAVVHLSQEAAKSVLSRLLLLPPRDLMTGYLALVSRSQGSGGVPGLRNRQLLSTHYLTQVLPRQYAGEWPDWGKRAQVLNDTGAAFFERLGYTTHLIGTNELLLGAADRPLAVAHMYEPYANLDRAQGKHGERDAVLPAAWALQAARVRGLDYAFVTAGPVLRLHRTRPADIFDETAAPGAFVEFDLGFLPREHLPLLWAVCAEEALVLGGRLEALFAEAQRYATGLRDRFRDRVYLEVVPALVRGLWAAAREQQTANPDLIYRSALTLLFRILFVLYAEDRNLLPVRHPGYRQRSLTRRVTEVLRTHRHDPEAFEPRQTDIWDDLTHTFDAIRDGHREWGVPPYDGGLFEDTGTPDAELLAAVRLPNAVMGPVLYRLAVDRQGEEEGKVDFGDLGVRHLGSLYEGLLSFRALVAQVDLTVNRREKVQTYVPALRGEPVEVRAGEVYLASPEGGRKTTGSYYTPEFAVSRLVEGALEPVLEAHITRLERMDDDAAAAAFFDVKVCDPAMGSGHFLARALDLIAEHLQGYLARKPLPEIADELRRARERVGSVGRQYGAPDLGEATGDFDLLRRLILKRCIYGVDLNPMAVELARLSLWLRAFVPGLPLSYLGHTLRCGNSLVGVAGPELVASLQKAVPLFSQRVEEAMQESLREAEALGSVDDLELHEVERSDELQRLIEQRAGLAHLVYDAYTGRGFDPELDWSNFLLLVASEDGGDGLRLPGRWEQASARARDRWNALHWPLAFPEVFLRERPGFDAILGNPPWEEVTVEELGFFVRYIPGLKSERSPEAQHRRIAELVREQPAVFDEYQDARARTAELRGYLRTAYQLTRSGDPDLYRAFCERFLHILRPGGSLGVVLPRAAFSGDGTAPFRTRLFRSGYRVQLDFLLNNKGWVFPDAHPQYTMALTLLADYGRADGNGVSVAGPAESIEQFTCLGEERVEWTIEDLGKASDGLEVPLIPDRRSAAIFRRLVTAHPRFDADEGGLRIVPWSEFHATNDRKSGLIRESGRGWPVYTGESFDLWNPDHTPPAQVIPPKEGLAELQRKRQRSKVWRAHFSKRALTDLKTLPQHRARILFRDVTNRTNSRTVISCLVPPQVFATNKAPSLLFPKGDAADMLYVLGMMCSVPFDWLARRRVETNLNFFILETLPLPRPSRGGTLRRRIVEVAGCLACPDERFREVAEAVDVAWGPLPPDEKASLIAELDALAAYAYGLSEDELRLMFEDFPDTEAGVSAARRAAVLDHYRSRGARLA